MRLSFPPASKPPLGRMPILFWSAKCATLRRFPWPSPLLRPAFWSSELCTQNNARKTVDSRHRRFPSNCTGRRSEPKLGLSPRGVIAQLLLKKDNGSGRVAARLQRNPHLE